MLENERDTGVEDDNIDRVRRRRGAGKQTKQEIERKK